ncbi:cytochrome P450 [Agrococcus citreus]|uniref:cytochrome P450 n=1 Tax=Agrococcus citreus TaxID=84643 RepID=UPI0031DB2F52
MHVPRISRFLLTSPSAIRTAEQDADTFTARQEVSTMVRALGGRPMLRKDDPEHAVEREAINPALRPRRIGADWQPRFERIVAERLDRLAEVPDDEVDLNRDFAAPVASRCLIEMLGFSDVTDEEMARWSTSLIAGIGNILDDDDIWRRAERTVTEVQERLDELLPRLRTAPDSSITSHLLHAGLPEEAVRTNVMLTISGGMNEPQHMITGMVWALDRHPAQRDRLIESQTGWAEAFEETVRWISPIGMLPRESTVETHVEGFRIPAGSNVGLLLASANRHVDLIDRPDEYDTSRGSRGHLGFGSGSHLCAGRWAAKSIVGDVALPRLYQRFPKLRVDDSRSTVWDGWVFRGITSLPVAR